MVQMSARYTGELHCEIAHGPSGSKLETDAPKDNQGKGERFSPTDLLGAALTSCILTTMGIVAKRDGIAIEGATASVEKLMSTEPPRRVAGLPVLVTLPAGLSPPARSKLEHAALNCPVTKSLHPEIQATITFEYR